MSPEHGGFQVFSDLDEATYSALKESIAARGVLVPIAVDQHRKIIDGHNRARAARELGVECPEVVVEIEDHKDGVDVARLLNTVRRHLDVEQRRSVVAELRKAGHSLRAIAGAVGVDPKTVRNDLDKSGGEGSPPERSTGADGKSYPATKPKPEPHRYSRCVPCGRDKRPSASPMCDECRMKAKADEKKVCSGGCGTVLDPRSYTADSLCADCFQASQPVKPWPAGEPAEESPERQRLKLRESILKAVTRSGSLYAEFTPSLVASALNDDEWDAWVQRRALINDWYAALEAHRPKAGLRLMGAGK